VFELEAFHVSALFPAISDLSSLVVSVLSILRSFPRTLLSRSTASLPIFTKGKPDLMAVSVPALSRLSGSFLSYW